MSDLYLGKVFTTSLQAARVLTSDENIRVFSGRHGLLRLDEWVEDYDTVATRELKIQSVKGEENVILFLTKQYAALAKAVWPTAVNIFDGSRGGISQLVRCYRIIKESR